ncbi:MAG: DUF1736 domain-containing protein [Saprospiraceae bacterium]|nr:DUF1736 domain-containing protein [Saprospiraceae bacterium]
MKKKPAKSRSKKSASKRSAVRKPAKKQVKAFWLTYWQPALILFVIPLALYSVTLSFGYVLDDKIVLSENKFVQQGWEGLADIFGKESMVGFLGEQKDLIVGARYRPLSLATFAIEYGIWGASPRWSHFFNMLFYALSGLLLFRVLTQFLSVTGKKWWQGIPFWATLLFLLHPIHTEVVANIKGRDEILALLFSLATLYYSIRYIDYKKVFSLVMAALSFFVALMAKENALTFLAVIPLTLYLFKSASVKQLGLVTGPLLLTFVLYLGVRVSVIGYLLGNGQEVTGIMNNPFYGTTFGEKYATIMYTLGQYLKLLFFPHPLTHDYYPYQVPIINWLDARALVSLALYLGLAWLMIRQWKKRPIVSWSIAYYIMTLSIVSNIVFPVGAPMNERFLFMPSIGATVLLAYLILDVLPNLPTTRKWGQQLSWGLLLLFVAGFSIKSWSRIPAWKDEMSLNRAAIKVSTNSARANSYMAYSLYQAGLQTNDQVQRKQLYEEALPYVNRALEIYPTYSDAVTCKGGLVAGLYQMDGDLDRLLAEFYSLLMARHVGFLDQYMAYLNGREDRTKLTQFYHRAGFQLLAEEQQNYPLAVQYLNYGIQIAPNNIQLLQDLASVYLAMGQYNNAIQISQRGLQLQAGNASFNRVLQEASRLQAN